MPCKSCKRQQELQQEFEVSKQASCCEDSIEEVVRVVTRSQTKDKSSELTSNQVLLNGWDPIDVSTGQDRDVNIGQIKLNLQEGQERPSWAQVSAGTAELKTLWRQWDRLKVIGNQEEIKEKRVKYKEEIGTGKATKEHQMERKTKGV